jgi:endonuclease/exonuclease/phosphatase family metal-dependent hydrolase
MKITTWNVENLFLLMDKYNGEDLKTITNNQWKELSSSISIENKHLGKVEEISNIINEIDSDIYLLQEVGGKESLLNLNKFFLNSKYRIFMNEGNSRRGICIGFLVKENGNYNYKFKTNRNLRLSDGGKIRRDFSQLSVSDKNGELKLIILNVHLKSQRSSENDYNGINQRELEIKLLKQLAKELEEKNNVPIIIGGDFNVDLSTEENYGITNEYHNFHSLKNSSVEDRCSHVFFSQSRILNQLDYLLISKKYKDIVDLDKSLNYRFKNEYGDNMGLPDSLLERQLFPSDHFPVILVLKIN